MRISIYTLMLLSIIVVFGCSRKVTRVDPNQQIDLSGRWNDSDSRKVANKMVTDFLGSARYRDFAEANGKRPTIVIGYIKNKTSEHIDADNYIKKFEMEIFNSGAADIVESQEFRNKLREERVDQQEFADPSTTAQWGKEVGADLVLFGTMTSETDTYKKEKVVNYITTLYLTDMETAKRVWFGQEEIKKYVKN